MGKPALCVPRHAVPIDFSVIGAHPIPREFFHSPTLLVDRDLCETDESLLQLIPYITVRDQDGKFFCYERGAAGAEARLHAKLSIGLGGHVDRGVGGMWASLQALLWEEAARELEEEVGLKVDREIEFDAVLYTGGTDSQVDKVHLGLSAEYRMDSHDAEAWDDGTHEAGVIERGCFLTLTELLVPETFERLELWSQTVVLRHRDALSIELGVAMSKFANVLYSATLVGKTGISALATQEVATFLAAVGNNLTEGLVGARIYDDSEISIDLAHLGDSTGRLAFSLGLLS